MSSFDALLLSDDDSVRDMATKLLVQEYLTVAEESFELRAYALEKVLPCLSVALERLSLEIVWYHLNDLIVAQYLYRNNPLHNKVDSKGYVKSLQFAAIEIRKMIKGQEEKAKAAALAQAQRLAKLKEEEEILFKHAVAARRSHFNQGLGNLYDRWIELLWRKDDPILAKSEIVNEFQKLLFSIEEDAHLMLCIRKIVKGFNSDGKVDTKFFENTPNYDYLIDGLPAPENAPARNVFTKGEFISDAYKSVAGWTSEDLDRVSQLMIDLLVAKEEKNKIKFDSIYKVPVIPNFDEGLGPFEWINAFFKCCQNFKHHDLDLASLQATYKKLNITKILNEVSKSNETDIVFSHLSRKIVASYGIDSYETFMEFLSKLSLKDNLPSNDQVLLSLRYQSLDKIFSKLKVVGEDHQEEFQLVANTLKAVESLSLGAQKFLADFIKDVEIHDWSFTKVDLVKMANLILQDVDDEQFVNVLNSLETNIASRDKIGSVNRFDHEDKCLADILTLKSDFNLTISAACSKALNSITGALENIYAEHKAFGTVFLRETSSVKSESGKIQEEEFLRNVAVSPELETQLLACRSAESSIEMNVFESKTFQILKSPKKEDTNIFFNPSQGRTTTELSFISIPILSKLQESIGAANIKLEGKDHKLDEQDASFILKATDQLFEIINEIDYRNKLANIVNSAKSYEKTHANLEIEAFVISNQKGESVKFYQLDANSDYSADNGYSKIGSFSPPYMLANPATLKELKSDDYSLGHLNDCYLANKNITADGYSYFPINGSKKEIIGILKLKLGESKDQEIDEGVLISKQLANAISRISSETITLRSIISRELDAESIDEATRQMLLFPKLLLLDQREAILNISSTSISELKSYKRPPKSVLFICKGVLYIFGKKPNELSGWNNIIKHINNDLLSEMATYDPTSKQKKIRFKRLESVFKKIQFLETGESTSPTYLFHSWLCINRELRRTAVISRQRRADLFSQGSDASSDKASLSDVDALESEEDVNNNEEDNTQGVD